jgi:dipeptidase
VCDTFVALSSITADRSLIFGKNSDREPNEAQVLEYHPPADYPTSRRLRCTYRSLPQVRHTYGVLLSRPFWMWGAEMGVNEKAVVIGNEAVFTRMPRVKEGQLLGMDLLRLALERSATAQTALETMVSLLAQFGQGGVHGYEDKNLVYHNSFLLADPREAWVLETAGPYWAALRVRVQYSISNGLTIGSEIDLSHPDLVENARRRGWLKSGQTFDFARCYSDWFYTTFGASRKRRARSEELLDSHHPKDKSGSRRGLTVAAAMAILRDHGGLDPYQPDSHFLMGHICAHSANGLARHAAQSTGSLVARLTATGATLWATGTSAPCTGVFKPIWLAGAVLPDLGPAPKGRYGPRSLWWRHEDLHRRILFDYPSRIQVIRDEQRALEQDFLDRASSASGKKRFALTEEAFRLSREAEERWLKIIDNMPVEHRSGLVFQRYWSIQNRNAGLTIPT